MTLFGIRRHDRAPSLMYVATDGYDLIDLTGYVSVTFTMRKRAASLPTVNSAAAVIVDGSTLRYDWQPGDTAQSGVYFAEFELVDAQGRKRTVPGDRPIRIEIADDLDNA